jgi:UDP-glucose 4-epimerase
VGHDVIVNLAGESGAVKSMEDPIADLDGNCGGNLVLLQAIRAHNPSAKLVFVGSRLQYGKPETIPVSEDHPRDALCVHAVHKNTIEEYLRVYAQLFGLRYTIARVTNPYGPGQPAGRVAYGVVNRMIHLALADQALPIYGDGSQQRDYVFVDDLSAALTQLADSEAANGRAFNVGSGEGTALVDMAKAIIGIAGGGHVEHVAWPRLAEQIETGDFVADISRIKTEIGWRPKTALRDGIEQTVAFHRSKLPS